jgi:hypothetical protein
MTSLNFGTLTVDPPSIPGNTITTITATLSGASPGDFLLLIPPPEFAGDALDLVGSIVNSEVGGGLGPGYYSISAANTVSIRVRNSADAPVDAPARNWMYLLFHTS